MSKPTGQPTTPPTIAEGVTDAPVSPLHVTGEVLEQARIFFEGCGVRGCEGTALIAGTHPGPAPAGDHTGGSVGRLVGDTLVVPDQVATPVPHASVTITTTGDLQVATALSPGQRYFARIHSHPALAFHSPTDDANPALTQEGAYSIVVPFFGLGLRDSLQACAVFVRHHHRWVELRVGDPMRTRMVSTDV